MNILKKIFISLNIIFSFTLIILILYKSEIVFDGTNRNYYLKYYLFSFSYLFLSIFVFRINQTANKILNLSTLCIILSFYLFEFYLSKKIYSEKNLDIKIKKYKKFSGKDWDRRSQYQVYRELLKTNKDAVPYFYPSELNIENKFKIHSLAGVSNSLTVFCNENGYYSINSSDRYGFNNPDVEWDAKVIDYVFVGDSLTHGYCVNRPHDIPSVIRKNYNQTVLNLGYGRNGPLIEYATLREYLPTKAKKIVFIYYEGNDLENLNQELKNNILLKYIEDENFSQNLKDKQSLIDNEKQKHISARSNGEKYKYIKLTKTRKLISQFLKKELDSNNQNINYKKNNLKELEKILFLSKKLVLKNKKDFYFVYLPSIDRYFKKESSSDELFYFDEIKFIVNKLNINFIDINKEVFEKEQNPLKLFPFELYAHYNIEGYKKVAETIYKLTKD